nr:META domain-containing protein [Acinetobacter sp. Marseille-Q1620]
MVKHLLNITLITSVFMILGCTDNIRSFPSRSEQGASLLHHRTWNLTHIGTLEFRPESGHKMPSIQFDQTHMRFSGFDGCNRIMGTYQINGQNIQIGPSAGTKMMCHNNQQLTIRFNNALSKVTSFRASGHTLKFLDRQGQLLLQFEATVQPR